MSKEKLKFKINGKSIVYEGYPENRPKDLMDILAKLGVAEDTVVPTFRENIDNADSYADQQITALYAAAVKARQDKKKSKQQQQQSSSEAPPAAAAEVEKPQKITLSYNGKQFSYEGLPSAKQSAVIQFLAKQKNITPQVAIETFRTNLPSVQATDDEIWAMVTDKVKSKQQATSGRNGDAAASSPSHSTNATTTAAAVASATPPDSAAAATASSQQQQQDYTAIDELASMTTREKEELNNFIKQVLEQPPIDVASLIREEPLPRGMEDDSVELAQTARMVGKYPVYCQVRGEKDTDSKKMVYITSTMTFEELNNTIEKKFGRKMALSFFEDEDEIELDDDDVLAMFIQLNAQGGRKPTLVCSNPAERKKALDDDLTTGTVATTTKVKSFSNGELDVKEVRTFAGHSLAVYCCAFSPKGDQFITASRDRSVRLWNVRTGSCTVMKGGHNGFVLSCDYSPKGNRVVSSSDDRTIKVWNTTSCSKVSTLKGHEDKVYCVQYNPTGEYIVSSSCDHTVRVWNAESCSKITTLKGHNLAVFSCCFSNSDRGKYVCSGSDDRLIKIWDWEAGKEVRSLVGHIGTVWSVRFSHNDKHIISASMDHELKMWNVVDGTCLRTMAGHKTPIHHAVFSDDDKYIFSCARDWTVMVWRAENGEHVETITGHLSTVYHVEVQGNKMLTSSLDDTLKLWDVKY